MTELLTTISVLFVIAGPFLLVASLLRLPTAPALILAGLVASLFIDDPDAMLDIARLGVALLVFTFAVRIQTTDVQTAIADSEVVALVQMAVVGTAGFGAGLLVGLDPDQAIYLGIVSAISSSIVGSTLFLPGTQELVHDRLSESIHSIQDFAGLFFLLVVGAGVVAVDPIATQLGYGVMLLVAAVAVNRYLYDHIKELSGGVDESMLVGTIALLLVFLAAAEFLGVSIVVGAFAAGVAVQYNTVEYSGVINGIESINGFFTAVFFLTVGALVTLSLPTVDVAVLALVLVGITGILKPAVTIALLLYRGYERRTAALTGFNVDQVGEFAIIIAIEAFFLDLLTPSLFDATILAAAITLVTSSFTRRYDERLYHMLANSGLLGRHGRSLERRSSVPENLTDHIVIVGYGRHGRKLVDTCKAHDQSFVVVESNPALLEELQEDCPSYVFGDIIEPKTLEKARLTDARLVISTADSRSVNEHIVSFSNQVDVIVRTKDRASARRFLEQGAFYAGVSDLLAADQIEERFEGIINGEYDGDTPRQKPGIQEIDYRTAPGRSADSTTDD